MNYHFRLAKIEEVEEIFSFVNERSQWMRSSNIHQWRHYLKHHPIEEWRLAALNCELYVAVCDNVILGCVQIQYYDPIFWDNTKNIYIKKLCTKLGTKKVGKYIIEQVILIAKKEGLSKIRLDCLATNQKLNNIYQSYGFHLVYSGVYGKYPYNLREMIVEENTF